MDALSVIKYRRSLLVLPALSVDSLLDGDMG